MISAHRVPREFVLRHGLVSRAFLVRRACLARLACFACLMWTDVAYSASPAVSASAAPAEMFPWVDLGDVPLQPGLNYMSPSRSDVPVYQVPGDVMKRRGGLLRDARVPIFGAHRAPQCGGRWFEIGPMAWVCADDLRFAGGMPGPQLTLAPLEDGLPYRYYFAGPDGAQAYGSLEYAGEEAPERQLEKGWSVPVVEQRTKDGESWGLTRAGQWVAMRELNAARSIAFHGEALENELNVAWVLADRIPVFAEPSSQKKTVEVRVRFQALRIMEEKAGREGVFFRFQGDSPTTQRWVRSKDVVRPIKSSIPPEVSGAASGERWIDIDLATQTLVAYEGEKPVFATLVSTGRGPQGSESATPRGIHRIWVKLFTTPMDNLEKEDAAHYYSIEDVPWVQFFDKGVALHAAFWHRDFGRVHSHGCVNLAPIDAHRLFQWTGPHLPSGWDAALPTPLEQGTWVRVR